MKLGVTMMPVETMTVQPSGYETWCDHDACGDEDSAAQWL
jgi:hypothetical protein